MKDGMVHVVDDDASVRKSVSFMLKTSGYQVRAYESGPALLRDLKALDQGCILLDVRMPEMDGLEVQQLLQDKGIALPVVIMTGHGDIPLSVRAMKAGAVDFIEKPFEKSVLIAAVEECLARRADQTDARRRGEQARIRLEVLTSREHEVLDGLAKGFPNKTIAYDLGISARTVEIHRANLMSKLEARSLSDVLRLAFDASRTS